MKKSHTSDVVEESEEQLVGRAQDAVSHCRWVVGECASKWTERYARGRTDADFAVLIGITADQVYQRRRVWEQFASVCDEFASLKWSHFYAALTWDDARDCLSWAEETRSTVAEMRAWRRARRGEDLTVEAPEEEAVRYVPSELSAVQLPGRSGSGVGRGESHSSGTSADERHAILAGVARQGGGEGDDYAPFRSGALTPPPREEAAPAGAALPEPPSTEQLTKRLSATLERFVKLMTPAFRREFRKLPDPVKERFHKAVGDLTELVAELS